MKREESKNLTLVIVEAIRANTVGMRSAETIELFLSFADVFAQLPAFKHPFADVDALAHWCNRHGALLWRYLPLGWRILHMDSTSLRISFPG